MAIEIVSFPINSMVIFNSYVSLPEGIIWLKKWLILWISIWRIMANFGYIITIIHMNMALVLLWLIIYVANHIGNNIERI